MQSTAAGRKGACARLVLNWASGQIPATHDRVNNTSKDLQSSHPEGSRLYNLSFNSRFLQSRHRISRMLNALEGERKGQRQLKKTHGNEMVRITPYEQASVESNIKEGEYSGITTLFFRSSEKFPWMVYCSRRGRIPHSAFEIISMDHIYPKSVSIWSWWMSRIRVMEGRERYGRYVWRTQRDTKHVTLQ